MKTILKIILILLVASVVAGAFSLAMNNTSITTGSDEGGQPAAITNASGQSFQPLERPEGDYDGSSITGGLLGVFGTLAELAGITALVLLAQKAYRLFGNGRLISIQR